MDFKEGELIEFTIAESDTTNYVPWFRYAAEVRAVGRIVQVAFGSAEVRCILVHPSKKLLGMKPGGTTVYTGVDTIKKLSIDLYEEI